MSILFNNKKIIRILLCLFLICLIPLSIFIFRKIFYKQSKHLTGSEYYQQAKVLEEKREHEKAEAYLLKALQADPNSHKAMMEMGYMYIRRGEFICARGWLEKALKYFGDDKKNMELVLYDLGETYLYEHDTENAWTYLNRAYGLKSLLGKKRWPIDPNDPDYFVMTNNRKKFNEIVEGGYPNDLTSRLSQLNNWSMIGQAEKILNDCRAYLSRNPGSRYTYLFIDWQAKAYLQLGDYDKTLLYLDMLNPLLGNTEESTKAFAMQMRYHALLYKNENTKALSILQKILMDYSFYIPVMDTKYDLADLYNKIGDRAKEQAQYEDIVETYPDSPKIYKAQMRLVEILTAQGQYSQAFKYLKANFSVIKMMYAAIGVILIIGLSIFIFFVFTRIFFVKNLPFIQESGLRLWHLWIAGSLFSLFAIFGSNIFYFINDATHNLLGHFHLDPFLLGIILNNVVIVLGCVLWLKYFYGFNRQKIGLYPKGVKIDVALSLFCAFGLFLVSSGWTWILIKIFHIHFIPLTPMDNFLVDILINHYIFPKVLASIATVICVPICEELFFRVFLFNFLKIYTNNFWAVVLGALAYAFSRPLHLFFPYYIFMAVLLSLLYLRTGSIYPSIVTHMFINILSFAG